MLLVAVVGCTGSDLEIRKSFVRWAIIKSKYGIWHRYSITIPGEWIENWHKQKKPQNMSKLIHPSSITIPPTNKSLFEHKH